MDQMLAALAVVGTVDLFVLGWASWLGRRREIERARR
jgi:hypothetical protein